MSPTTHCTAALSLVLLVGIIASSANAAAPRVEKIEPPEDGFFGKKAVCLGIPIKAHADVADAALVEAHRRLARMLGKLPAAVENLVAAGAELHVIGRSQQTSDLPYLRHWKGKPYDAHGETFASIDARTRGIGGILASCGEENLLKLPSDRYKHHRDICSHEFAHTLYSFGFSPNVRALVREQFARSTAKGLWKTAYASTNDDEFFAELTMWYVGSRGDYGKIEPTPEEGQAWLRRYDPEAFALLDRIYSGRIEVERLAWQRLGPRSPSEEKTLRSRDSSRPSRLLIHNRTDTDLELYWLDFEGRRKRYGQVRAGQKSGQSTFTTHPWVLADREGKAVAVFIPDAPHCLAVVEPPTPQQHKE